MKKEMKQMDKCKFNVTESFYEALFMTC